MRWLDDNAERNDQRGSACRRMSRFQENHDRARRGKAERGRENPAGIDSHDHSRSGVMQMGQQ